MKSNGLFFWAFLIQININDQLNASLDINNSCRNTTSHNAPLLRPCFSQTDRPGSWWSRVWRAAEEDEDDEEACADHSSACRGFNSPKQCPSLSLHHHRSLQSLDPPHPLKHLHDPVTAWTHTQRERHTDTHTHVGFYGLRGLSISVMVFILYKLYVLLPYTYPTPKLSPHRRRCISTFPPKKLTLYDL